MKDFDVTAFIMGIAHPSRMRWLIQSINRLDEQNFPFRKKIVSIDQFGGNIVNPNDINILKDNGWTVLLDSHKSRVLSMDRAFKEIETEYTFYNEDDILITLPNFDDLVKTFNTKIEDKACSMISMNFGGMHSNPNTKMPLDWEYIEKNAIVISENYFITKRMSEFASAYFFEFPALWIKTDIFRRSHNMAKRYSNQVEESLTKAYKELGFYNTYYKASIIKKECLKTTDYTKIIDCLYIELLDPQQGKSVLGGSHNY